MNLLIKSLNSILIGADWSDIKAAFIEPVWKLKMTKAKEFAACQYQAMTELNAKSQLITDDILFLKRIAEAEKSNFNNNTARKGTGKEIIESESEIGLLNGRFECAEMFYKKAELEAELSENSRQIGEKLSELNWIRASVHARSVETAWNVFISEDRTVANPDVIPADEAFQAASSKDD